MKSLIEKILKTKIMKNKIIILGEIYYLDLGSLSPIAIKPIKFTKRGVLCKYLHSWPGRIEEVDFEFFSINGFNVNEYEK